MKISLREFGLVTQLKCGPFPIEAVVLKAQKQLGNKRYSDKLIGEGQSGLFDHLINRLESDKGMEGCRKLRIALLIIVEV